MQPRYLSMKTPVARDNIGRDNDRDLPKIPLARPEFMGFHRVCTKRHRPHFQEHLSSVVLTR